MKQFEFSFFVRLIFLLVSLTIEIDEKSDRGKR